VRSACYTLHFVQRCFCGQSNKRSAVSSTTIESRCYQSQTESLDSVYIVGPTVHKGYFHQMGLDSEKQYTEKWQKNQELSSSSMADIHILKEFQTSLGRNMAFRKFPYALLYVELNSIKTLIPLVQEIESIGRSSHCTIRFPMSCSCLSALHLLIFRRDNNIVIADNSRNGVTTNEGNKTLEKLVDYKWGQTFQLPLTQNLNINLRILKIPPIVTTTSQDLTSTFCDPATRNKTVSDADSGPTETVPAVSPNDICSLI